MPYCEFQPLVLRYIQEIRAEDTSLVWITIKIFLLTEVTAVRSPMRQKKDF